MATSLYDSDFFSWTEEQARHLRAGRIELVYVDHLVEEIETLGRSEAAALKSSGRLIAMHLLKMMRQPGKATESWENTVNRERLNVESTLSDNPGLKSRRLRPFDEAYALARREAAFETKLPETLLPSAPPFGIDEAESGAFWPEGFPLQEPSRPGVVGPSRRAGRGTR